MSTETTDFYDRYNELKSLYSIYDARKSEFVLIWGRRRLGKTELIKKFFKYAKDKKLYLFVPTTEEKGIMTQFQKDIEKQTGDIIKISSWDIFFEYLEQESEKSRLVVVFDEFQRIHQSSPLFISTLQNKWDSVLRKKNIMVVLCGSSMGMMHKLILSSNGPLYGRTTTKMKLNPFRYADFRLMFKELSEIERIEYFSVFGGTPHYLTLAKNQKGDLFQKIFSLMIKENGNLTDEPQYLLSWELHHPYRYNSILNAIARGKTELKEIADYVGKNANQILPYINNLENLLGLVIPSQPLLGKKRQTRYKISDNFFRFWYKFIFPNKALIEIGNAEAVMGKIKSQLNGYIGFIFEEIVKELFILYNRKKMKEFNISFEEIGSWWLQKGGDIDIVMKSRTDTILCEVKWWDKLVGLDVLKELKENSKEMQIEGRIRFCLVSKMGFEADLIKVMDNEKILYLDLKEIENLFEEHSQSEKGVQKLLDEFN